MLQKLIFRHAITDFSARERSGKHSRHFSILDIAAEYSTITKKLHASIHIKQIAIGSNRFLSSACTELEQLSALYFTRVKF